MVGISSIPDENAEELLPNGYSRQNYYDQGYSDEDIEFWGLDQPEAPDPNVAGFIIYDIFDIDSDLE